MAMIAELLSQNSKGSREQYIKPQGRNGGGRPLTWVADGSGVFGAALCRSGGNQE
jgi:hypothetical protein